MASTELYADPPPRIGDNAPSWLCLSEHGYRPTQDEADTPAMKLASPTVAPRAERLTAYAAAKLLGLSPQNVAQLCRRGNIAAEKDGRTWLVSLEDVRWYGGYSSRSAQRTRKARRVRYVATE